MRHLFRFGCCWQELGQRLAAVCGLYQTSHKRLLDIFRRVGIIFMVYYMLHCDIIPPFETVNKGICFGFHRSNRMTFITQFLTNVDIDLDNNININADVNSGIDIIIDIDGVVHA